jgi:hypothetical protein
MADTSMRVGDKKPSLNTKVFEVVDQKLIKIVIKCMSGLMGALEANMASVIPKYSHLSFKPMCILSTQDHQSDFGRGHGSNLISILKGPHLVFLC